MAQMVLMTESHAPSTAYKNGDILAVFNDLEIDRANAEILTNPYAAARNGSGFIDVNDLSFDAYNLRYQYRFERTNDTIIRTEIATSEQVNVSDQFHPSWIFSRIAEWNSGVQNGLPLFGTVDDELWFGGKIDNSQTAIDNVWTQIEAKTSDLRSSFPLWPFGSEEVKSHLYIGVLDVADFQAEDFVQSEFDNTDPDNPIIVTRRRHFVDWENVLGFSAPLIVDIKDDATAVTSEMSQSFDTSSIVSVKP